MSKWIVAERRDNKAVIVFNLHSKGVKVSNSFDSMKAADNFIVEHSYNEYFPMLMRDSGISIKTFMAKYPLKQAETTPKKADIKKTIVVPEMKVKTVATAKPKQTVSKKVESKPTPKPQKSAIVPTDDIKARVINFEVSSSNGGNDTIKPSVFSSLVSFLFMFLVSLLSFSLTFVKGLVTVLITPMLNTLDAQQYARLNAMLGNDLSRHNLSY